MYTRRSFLKTSTIVSIGSFALPKSCGSSAVFPPPGLQLFTFFNVIDNDVTGTLKQIASLGYKNIESAFSRKGGYYGMRPKEFSTVLKDLGLSWKSHHVLGAPFKMPANAKPPAGPDGKPITIPVMKNLRDNFQELVDEAAEGGVEYLVCANTPISSTEELKNSVAVLNKTAEAATKAGMQFAYHNHDAEFHAVDGVIPYDLFLSETNPQHVKMELDLAWAVKGGTDPVELFKKHPGRFPLWHVKDLDAERKNVLPVGEGTIDFKRIFENAAGSGMKYYFVEHDMPADALASISSSMKNLKKLTGR
ncbi:MAG TPA: sugar phosphate isomerase/epimerase [Flavitalea sp.]|nr:sugar phosphate isomerase/epimerase [Flavitalea sp.]